MKTKNQTLNSKAQSNRNEVCRFEEVGAKDDGVEVLHIEGNRLLLECWRETPRRKPWGHKPPTEISLLDSLRWFNSRIWIQARMTPGDGDGIKPWLDLVMAEIPASAKDTWEDKVNPNWQWAA